MNTLVPGTMKGSGAHLDGPKKGQGRTVTRASVRLDK